MSEEKASESIFEKNLLDLGRHLGSISASSSFDRLANQAKVLQQRITDMAIDKLHNKMIRRALIKGLYSVDEIQLLLQESALIAERDHLTNALNDYMVDMVGTIFPQRTSGASDRFEKFLRDPTSSPIELKFSYFGRAEVERLRLCHRIRQDDDKE